MSLYSIRSGVSNHPEDTFLQQLTDLVSSGGVVSLSGDDYLVEEPAGGGLNVDVNPGRGYVKGAGSCYPIRNTATETVAITSNTSGNPRITTLVAYVDLAVSPGNEAAGADVHLLKAINGTPASSPSAPDDGAIQTAVSGANPWIRLADIVVAHNASGISNNDITDRRRRVFFKSHSPLLVASYSSPYAHDYALTNQFQMTLTGNLTLNAPTNMEVGDWAVARLIQDGTGNRLLTLGSGIEAKSPDMTLASGAGDTTTIALHKVGSSNYDAYLVGKDY